jgi:hypothetical protein
MGGLQAVLYMNQRRLSVCSLRELRCSNLCVFANGKPEILSGRVERTLLRQLRFVFPILFAW